MLSTSNSVEKKSDITTYMTSKVKWKEVSVPNGNVIVVDIDAIAIQSSLLYIQEQKFALDFVYDFFTECHIDKIFSIYRIALDNIKIMFNNVILVSSLHSENSYNKPKLGSLTYEGIVELKKNIHTYIIKGPDVYRILKEKTREKIIVPTEEHLLDKSLLLASLKSDVLITYDPHVFMFGKNKVYKYYENKWFIKTKNDFNDAMNLGNINDFSYSCLLLGTRFGKAKKSTTLRSIRECKDKKGTVLKIFAEHPVLEKLEALNL